VFGDPLMDANVDMYPDELLRRMPYLPVMDLVAKHCRNLALSNVDGLMLSWTLGGYPSPNLELADSFNRTPVPSVDEALEELVLKRFGVEGAAHARRAWRAFSDAFREYPYSQTVLYNCPAQTGPANLLYPTKTGRKSTMVGFPYDAVENWCPPYPAEIFASQFTKVASGWRRGLNDLQTVVMKSPREKLAAAEDELIYARVARIHFQSIANQTHFILSGDALADSKRTLMQEERRNHRDRMRACLENEIELAREMFLLSHRNSCLGYEAANQYVYLPLDFVEKVIC
jgi:hypothetical protein